MSEAFSVKAILSAEDGSFRSVFGNAQGILQRFSDSTSGLTGGLGDIWSTVKNGLGFGVLQGVGQKAFGVLSQGVSHFTDNMGDAVARYDTIDKFPSVMEKIGIKSEDASKIINSKLVPGIDGLPTTLDSIVANTRDVTMVTRDLDKSTDIVLALNNAFLGSGSSSFDAERGTRQFVQALSKGKFQGDDWITIMETMGPAVYKVAEYMGFNGANAANDLKEALGDGTITMDDFTQALVDLNDEVMIGGEKFEGFESMARASTGGIETSVTNLKTAVTKGLADMIKATDLRLQESGDSIKGYFDGLKDIINKSFKTFINSDVFQSLVTSAQKTVDAMGEAFERFTHSPAMQTVHDNLDNLAKNLGVILPNVIKGLEPVITAVAKVATGILSAISDAIAKITSSPAFMTFCQNIGKAIEKVGGIVEKVIRESERYIGAVLDAGNEVMDAFGKTFDAISNTAEKTRLADKVFQNFQKVLDVVKTVLMKVAGFLEKHHDWIIKIIEHLPTIIGLIGAVKIALLVLEKVKAFKSLIDQVVSFGKSLKDTITKTGDFVSNFVDKLKGGSDNAGTAIEKMAGKADTSWSRISSGAGDTGNAISSKIGGGFGKAQSAAAGASSGILSKVGGIAAAAGAAAGIIAGIVTAVIEWREEQKKLGAKMVEFNDDQQKTIDKTKELTDSFKDYKDSMIDSVTQTETEMGLVGNLREEYNKLLDKNGEVIKGKEDLANAIQEKIFQAMGFEKDEIDDLCNEYLNLLDQNGKIKQGYEDRASAIEKALSDIVGHEVTGKEQVANIQGEIMDNIDRIIEKKKLEAQTEQLNEAVIEAQKKRKELQEQQLEIYDLIMQKKKELADIEDETSGKEFDNNIQKQEAIKTVKEQIEELETQYGTLSGQVEQTTRDERIATEGVTKALEEQLDKTGEFAGQTQLYWERYIGDVNSAEDAVRKHGTAAREVLDQQVRDAEEKYTELKAAHDAGNEGITESQLAAAEKQLEYARQQRRELVENKQLGLAEEYQAQLEADEKAIAQQEEHVKKISQMRQDQNAGLLAKEQEKLDKLKAKRDEDELAYTQYMENLNTTGSEKLGELTRTTETETQKQSSALTNNTKTGTDNSLFEWGRLATGIPIALSPITPDTQRITAEACKGVQSTVVNSSGAITGAVGGVVAGMSNKMAEVKTDLPNSVSSAMNQSTNAISNSTPALGAAAQGAKKAVVNPVSNMGGELSDKTSVAMGLMAGQLDASKMAFSIAAMGLVTSIAGGLSGLSSQLNTVGHNAIVGLQNGLNARAGSVYNTAQSIAANVANIMAAALQINSPSRLTRWMGRMVDEGFVRGLSEDSDKAGRAARGVAESVYESMNNVCDNYVIPFPDIYDAQRQLEAMNRNPNLSLNTDYDYNGSFHAKIEVPVNLDGREISRVTVDTDSQEQYFNQRRYMR